MSRSFAANGAFFIPVAAIFGRLSLFYDAEQQGLYQQIHPRPHPKPALSLH
jgi:hypothetical protein